MRVKAGSTDFTLTIPLPYAHADLSAQVVTADGEATPVGDPALASITREEVLTEDGCGLEPRATVTLPCPPDAGDYFIRWSSSDGFGGLWALDALFVTA